MVRVWVLLILLLGAAACTHNSDCGDLQQCADGTCKHKNLWPLAWQEYLGTLLIFLLLGMANASGLGGGVIMIPLLITVFLFSTHQSVALSLTIATVGSGTAYLAKMSSHRPGSTRSLVDYEVAMLMQPGMLAGVIYGVILNVVFPSWLLLVMLATLLLYMCVTSFQKGLRVFKAETEAAKVPLLQTESGPKEPLLPPGSLAGLALTYCVALLFAFCAGSKANPSFLGIETCTIGYWLLFAGYSLVCALLQAVFGWLMMRKLAQGRDLQPGDMPWTSRSIIGLGLCGFAAGLAGAMLGIGGGVIIGPVLLAYNVHAQTTAATAIFMVCFGASISTLQYIIQGILQLEYALFFTVVSILGSMFGVIVVKWLVDKYNRSSLIIFILAGILGVSAVVLPIFDAVHLYQQSQEGTLRLGFQSFCS